MARRRNNRRRKKGRFAALYKVLAFLAICGAIVVAMALFFKADEIKITGNDHYTAEEVLKASGIKTGDNLYLLNKFEVAERIRSRLPYVESVQIRRRLPDTLTIAISECPNAMGVEQDGKLWVLCGTGRVVDMLDAKAKSKHSMITGIKLKNPKVGKIIVGEDEKVTEELLEILHLLNEKGMLANVQAIHLENPALITIRYMKAFDVEFLWGTDWDYKLNYLAAVVEKLEENEKGTIILTQDGEARFIPA
ncbi:MAG: FtsQ-type POTRA domain-containing protein [Clostridiales bacterium]|nr:FtsQ-type POTRA domain-containing protein [Candidatus Cacconaster stercorequi]